MNKNSTLLPSFFRRLIAMVLAVSMVVSAPSNRSNALTWAGFAGLVLADICSNLLIESASSLWGYFSEQFEEGHSQEFEDLCISIGLNPDDYESEEDLYNDPLFLVLLETLMYDNSQFEYSTSFEELFNDFKANYAKKNSDNKYFTDWRIIDDGYEDDYYQSTYLTQEQAYSSNNLGVNKIQPTLFHSTSPALFYEVGPLDGINNDYSFEFYDNIYIASNIFTVSKDSNVAFNLYTQSEIISDFTNENVEINSNYSFAIYEYTGDDYLNDSSFFDYLTNTNWVNSKNKFTSGYTYYGCKTDIFYVLIIKHYLSPSSWSNLGDDRNCNYVMVGHPTIIEGGYNFDKSPEPVDSTVYTSIINNYTNYYNSGNWYNGDYEDNSDNSTGGGSGSGSGDGTVSGDLNVHVDGSLDHNVDGGLDININLPSWLENLFPTGTGSDPPEDGEDGEDGDGGSGSGGGLVDTTSGFFVTLLSFLFAFLLDCLDAIVSPILDLLTGFLDATLGRFLDITELELFDRLKSIFSWLPDELQEWITTAIMLVSTACIFILIRKVC